MNDAIPILYSHLHCPFSIRARLAIVVSNRRCELREVDLAHKPAELLEVSPKGTVPVLIDKDGKIIDQSMDILYWALAQNDPLLWKQFDIPQAEVKTVLEENENRFVQALIRLKKPERFAGENDSTDWREVAEHFFAKLEQKLDSFRYLAGGHITVADIATVPFVLQYCERKPEILANPRFTKMANWVEGFRHSDLYRRAMQEHPAWQAGQAAQFFP